VKTWASDGSAAEDGRAHRLDGERRAEESLARSTSHDSLQRCTAKCFLVRVIHANS
jgi:hypothetical protein